MRFDSCDQLCGEYRSRYRRCELSQKICLSRVFSHKINLYSKIISRDFLGHVHLKSCIHFQNGGTQ